MKYLKVLVALCVGLLSFCVLQAQSLDEQIANAKQLKAQYGETDEKYLDALSGIISTAGSEKNYKVASEYRSIHTSIMRKLYGENSLEYASGLCRLGNIAKADNNEDAAFGYYKKAYEIYSNNNAIHEYYYCDLAWQLYLHYYGLEEWDSAVEYLKKHIELYPQWVDKYLSIQDLAHCYNILGRIYRNNLHDYAASVEANSKAVDIIEEKNLHKVYEYSWMPYKGNTLNYGNLEDYVKTAEWYTRYLVVLEERFGEMSDEYVEELGYSQSAYFLANDFDSLRKVSQRLLSILEQRDSQTGTPVFSDQKYLAVLKEYRDNCSSFDDYAGAVSSNTRLMELYKQAGDEKSERFLEALRFQIRTFQTAGLFQESYSFFPSYEKISKDLCLCETEEYCEYLSLKLDCLTSLYKTDEYMETMAELKSIIGSLYGEKSKKALLNQISESQYYESLEKHDEALNGISRCYQILSSDECLFDSEDERLVYLSEIHFVEGTAWSSIDSDKAIAKLRLSISEKRAINNSEIAPMINLGKVYMEQKRDAKKALECFLPAKDSLEIHGDKSSTQLLTLLNNSGACYRSLGDYSTAMGLFDQAVFIAETVYGKNHPIYGSLAQNKSACYALVSNYDAAIKSCIEAMNCYEALYGHGSEKFAITKLNLSTIYEKSGQPQAAKEALAEAMDLLQECGSPYSIVAYAKMIIECAREKDEKRLRLYVEKAESLLVKYSWEESDVASILYAYIGKALAMFGDPGFKDYYGQALRAFESKRDNASVTYLGYMLEYGESSLLQGTVDAELIPKLVVTFKRSYQTDVAYYNTDERGGLLSDSRIKDVLFSSRRGDVYDVDLYNYLVFSKGLLLGTSMEYAKAVYNSGDKNLISQYGEIVELRKYIDGERVSFHYDASVEEAEKELSLLERQLSAALHRKGNYVDALNVSFEDIRQALDNKTISVEFVNYEDLRDSVSYYAAMVVGKDYDRPKFVKLCESRDLETYVSVNPGALYTEGEMSERLYGLVWEPLQEYLKSVTKIVFSPSGYLNRLAIEHLYKGNKRIGELYDIRRVTSTRVLLEPVAQTKYSSAVLYGGLIYDEDEGTMVAESRNVKTGSSVLAERFRGWNDETIRSGWEYLPGSLKEVNDIASILKKGSIQYTLYSGEKGNEESFKSQSGRNIRLIHLATHGFYISEEERNGNEFVSSVAGMDQYSSAYSPSLQRAGLLLSGGNKAWLGKQIPNSIEDGILTAAEIAKLDLNSCDIVVLSACETGLGEITDEGVFGLQRAFKNAGANTIVMSLWDVDDQATALMMKVFYKNLMGGKGKREAFSIAQNEVRKKYVDPRYWAAFIMIN